MRLLISAGHVLIGPAGEQLSDGAVLVEGREIIAVGPKRQVERLTALETPRMDHPDGTIMPGLIDCHVHLAFNAGPDPKDALEGMTDAQLVLTMAGRARQLLETGVTTVRDLGDWHRLTVPLRAATAEGQIPGPRILAATTPLTSRGGHCAFLGGEVDDEHSIRELVRTNAAAGADLIKVMATGGHLTPSGPSMWDPQFTTEQLKIAVDQAHQLGLPVAAHAHATDGIAAAIQAGADTIEHCTWLS